VQEPIKFLLVDDVPENLVALAALLRRDGLELLQARSGSEALELLLVHEVALALLDVQMPGMDGFELAELMRGAERTKHVPIIFVTAGEHDARRAFKGYESGAVDFLFKPIDPRILKSKADVFFELYRQRRELAGALRLNEMFVAILGHDLRNPLATLVTGSELLRSQATEPMQERVLQRMTAAAGRMTRMIDQLLDLTRARLAGGLGFAAARKPVDVASLVQRTVDELRGAHPERALSLEVDGDATIHGDADRLLQLFSNLLANALNHGSPAAPVVVCVAQTVAGSEREVVVTVRNGGVIPADLLPTLFDPFRLRETASGKARGLGLGLYISKQIADSHGARIEVASSPERGETTFAVHLPRVQSPSSRPSAE
jgi:signal transduction histidine kinase